MERSYIIGCLLLLFLVSGCATSNHGTFVNSTYIEKAPQVSSQVLGNVRGESRQAWFLYIFPIGESPSTNQAILDAKSKIEGIAFLTDVSIDDRTHWKFGYSEQVIQVDAVAHK